MTTPAQKTFLLGKSVSEYTFVEILFAVIIAWVLVALWQRFIENFAYHSLHLNIDSAYHSFIVAIVVTLIFVGFAIIFQNGVGSIIEGEVEGSGINVPSGPEILQTRTFGENDYLPIPNIQKFPPDFLNKDVKKFGREWRRESRKSAFLNENKNKSGKSRRN